MNLNPATPLERALASALAAMVDVLENAAFEDALINREKARNRVDVAKRLLGGTFDGGTTGAQEESETAQRQGPDYEKIFKLGVRLGLGIDTIAKMLEGVRSPSGKFVAAHVEDVPDLQDQLVAVVKKNGAIVSEPMLIANINETVGHLVFDAIHGRYTRKGIMRDITDIAVNLFLLAEKLELDLLKLVKERLAV